MVGSAIFGDTGQIRVFRVRGGTPGGTKLEVGSGFALGQFVPNDPTRLVTASATELTLWDVSDPEHPRTVRAPIQLRENTTSQLVTLLAVSPDGRTAATSAASTLNLSLLGSTDVWDLESGAHLFGPLPGQPGEFTAGGTHVALRRSDEIAFVDARTGADQRTLPLGFTPGNQLKMSDDGRRLAVADEASGAMHVFDVATGQEIGQPLALLAGGAYPMAFLSDDRLLVGSPGGAAVWRYLDGAPPLATFLPGHTGFMRVQFTDDGKEIITHDDHEVLRFRARDGRPLGRLLESRVPGSSRVVAIGPDGSTVAVQEAAGIVSLWDVRDGRRESVLATGLTGAQINAAFSRDGNLLAATSGFDHDLVLWDVSEPRRPEELHRVGGADDRLPFNFRGATFSPDGRVVAVNDFPELGWASFIDVRRGRVLRQIPLGFQIGGLVYSPDGTTVMTIRYTEDSVLLLDAATGTIRAERQATGWVQEWAFVHGGRRIALQYRPSVGNSVGPTTLELWDATTLEPFGEPVTITGTTGGGEASPDGSRLATGTPSGHAILFDLDPRHWDALACRIAGRNLTRAEWDQYLPGREYHVTCAR